MDTAVLGLRIVLAGVFTAAAIGKLFDLSGSRQAMRDFGLGEAIAPIAGTILPVLELGVAVALLVRGSAQWGAVAAVVLLLAFIAGISRALSRGEAPDCHCFGAIHSAPVGRSQLLRNGALTALALFVLIEGPGTSLGGWARTHNAVSLVAVIVAMVALLLLAVALYSWTESRRLKTEVEDLRQKAASIPPGLPVGALAPAFSVPDGDGGSVSLDELRRGGRDVALLFFAPGCGPCSSFAPEVERWRKAIGGGLTVGMVGFATLSRFVDIQARTGQTMGEIMDHTPDLDRETQALNRVFEAYRLVATPSAVIVTPEGTIASATVNGRPGIEALIRLTLSRHGRALSGPDRTTAVTA